MLRKARTSSSQIVSPVIAVLSAAGLLFATGCSNMVTTAVDGPIASGALVKGTVHGGNQPVGYATVQIYTVGQSGLGSSGTLLATTTTDAGGAFSFSKQATGSYPNTGNIYACPSNGSADPLTYIISHGGNTTGSGGSSINNSAAVFLAPLGFCSQVSSSQTVVISEVTTAATVASLAQFINPATEQIGNDGIGIAYTAIANSMLAIPNLVSYETGNANGVTTISGNSSGYNVSSTSVTLTPSTNKLNTIANILSSCINQVSATGSNCSSLFSAAVPPASAARTSQPGSTFPAATDTLQAALYMFLNPTDSGTANRTTLFNLSPATGAPYQPTITTLPTDWTLAVSYSSTGACGSVGAFFANPYDLGIDSLGNLWAANSTSDSLVEISPSGLPLTCQEIAGRAKAGGTVDIAGNIWYGDSTTGGSLYRYTPSSHALRTYSGLPAAPQAITTDGTGNVYFTTLSGSTGSLYFVSSGATSSGANVPIQISNIVGPNPGRIFPDRPGNVWVTTGTGTVVEVMAAASAGPGSSFLNGYSSTPFTVPSPSSNVQTDPNNIVYVISQDAGSTITALTPANGSYTVASGFPTAANAGGLNAPQGFWVDGAATSWSANNSSTNSSTGQYSVAVVQSDGTPVSASGTANGGYQKSTTYLNAGRALIIDSSGNVWISNDNNPNSVTKIVGAAVPVYQPYALGLNQQRFQTIP